MKLFEYLKKMSKIEETERIEFLGYLEMRNLASAELTETDMWILTNAAENTEYLTSKLAEEELTPAPEAPDETPTVDPLATTDTAEVPAVDTATEVPATDVVPTEETPTEPSAEETPTEETIEDDEDEDDSEIETSKEGIGVLALLGEIQEKLATGKPSPVEVAAIKALKKLVS